MSQSNNTLKILNLKDENIKFHEDFVEEVNIKRKRSLVFHGILSFIPTNCYKCGVIFDNNIIKHGFKTSNIKLPKISNLDTYLSLKKQRYLCRHCNSTFILNTNIVDNHCYVSNNTKHSIAINATKKLSECDIASNHNVSHSTVNRIINSYYDSVKLYRNHLPENLCFDEFKSVKNADGNMSFIFCNADTGEIIDIVEDRRLNSLLKYFKYFSRESRSKVKNIVVDMHMPYITVIKQLFPNANIVTDRFHTIQLISRSLNKTRIKVMNQDKVNYRKFKRYWKLLLKARDKLDYGEYRKYTCFHNLMREVDIVDYLLDQNKELKATYYFYQDIYYSIRTRNINEFKRQINKEYNNLSNYMETSLKTLIQHQGYIINSLKEKYSNGVLEGINNMIKTIKRIAFGYRSFYHFKARIMIIFGLISLKT